MVAETPRETEVEKVERWRLKEFLRAKDKTGAELSSEHADELARSDADLHRFYALLAAGCDLETARQIVA